MRWEWVCAVAIGALVPACGDDRAPGQSDGSTSTTSMSTSTTIGSGTSSGSGPTVSCSVSETMIERTENAQSAPLVVVGDAEGDVEELEVTVTIDDGPLYTIDGGSPIKTLTRPATSPFHYEYPLECLGGGTGDLQVILTATSAIPGAEDAVETKVIPYLCNANAGGSTGTDGTGSTGTDGSTG
jgi:hypothetical protein